MSKLDAGWHSVKGLFRWYFKDGGETSNVEERVVLFRAANLDEALDMAEREALTYCEEDPTANYLIESMGWWNAYRIADEAVGEGTEIHSRLMDTALSSKSFLRRYFPTSHNHKAP